MTVYQLTEALNTTTPNNSFEVLIRRPDGSFFRLGEVSVSFEAVMGSKTRVTKATIDLAAESDWALYVVEQEDVPYYLNPLIPADPTPPNPDTV